MIYLDNNSTTQCASEVVAAMLPYFTEVYANPASLHLAGRSASRAVAEARERVALTIGATPESILFTSGATEANNLSLLGLAHGSQNRTKVAVSAVEHKSILGPAKHLADNGFVLEVLPVDSNGLVILEEARRIIDTSTLVVSVQGANNETGTVEPVKKLAQVAHECGALFHCDATQLLGKLPVDVAELEVDLASFSAHKVYGPKGVGALFVSKETSKNIRPLLYGAGGYNGSLRPGTKNVPAIVGFGKACQIARAEFGAESNRIGTLRNLLERKLLESIPATRVNCSTVARLPGTVSFTIARVPGDMLVANLMNVCISTGSACNSGAPEPSHVLLAMKVNTTDAECTVRISLGRYTTEADICSAHCEIASTVNRLRAELGVGGCVLE